VDAYKDNKNLCTSVFIKIVTYCKLNKYNTIDDYTDISAYYSILPSVYKELCYTANSNSDRGVGINYSKDKDVSIDDSKDKDIGVNNSKNKDVSADNSKDKDIGIDNSKDKDISANDFKNKNIGTDDSIGENDLD
jgi:hypothetical protein